MSTTVTTEPAPLLAALEAALPPLLTPAALADLLHVSAGHVRNLLWQGGDVPPALKIGRRTYFERADVVRWLRERARPMGGAR